MSRIYVILFLLLIVLLSCNQIKNKREVTADHFQRALKTLTDITVHDITSPPVASRYYVYPAIAAYEVLALNNEYYKSLSGQLNGLQPIPIPDSMQEYDFKLAGMVAYYEIVKTMVFSEEKLVRQYSVFLQEMKMGRKLKCYNNSVEYGKRVAAHIIEWMEDDLYKETRTFPKFTIRTDEPGRWQPTPPDYMEGIEPHWMKIRPFVIDSAQQFKPKEPPEFSMNESSEFYQELLEVYNVRNDISDEEVEVAKFWDCNPYVSQHRGHLMFALKKITPGGHWVGIAAQLARNYNFSYEQTVCGLTKVKLTIADGFISCWDEKYRSNLVRPETLINKFIDEDWIPILQTPPFPEYTSGHSVVSGAASVACTNVFGDNIVFADSVEVEYGLPVRSFKSFYHASDEAAISRLYGGIHYRSAIDNGLQQGRDLGHFIISRLKMNNEQ